MRRSSALLDGLQILHPVDDVAIVRVQPVDLEEGAVRELQVAHVLIDPAQIVEQPDRLDLLDVGGLETLPIPLDRELRHPLLEEAEAEHAAALDHPLRILARELELSDRLIGQTHLLISDS